ncbi:hypothetical protein B0H10DRAFT_1994915, partial [Mycena sp. CBHHK59/15]
MATVLGPCQTLPVSPILRRCHRRVSEGHRRWKPLTRLRAHSPCISLITSRRRIKQRAVVHTSGEDSDDGNTKSSARRSPKLLHPISTPKSYPSSTPPTSDEDMPARILSTSRSKGKGKGLASRHHVQVLALQFNDEPGTNDRKRTSEKMATNNKLKLKVSPFVTEMITRLNFVSGPYQKREVRDIRDRGRIAGAQKVSVQRAEIPNRRTLHDFFLGVQSDSSFSSSPGEHHRASTSVLPEAVSIPSFNAVIPVIDVELPALDDSDEENLPDAGDLLKAVKQEKTLAEKQKELRAIKMRALAAQAHSTSIDDDDDDLEIAVSNEKAKDIVYTEAAERGSAGKKRLSEGRKRQMTFAGISLAQQRAKQSGTPAKPLPLASGTKRTHDQLTRDLAKLVAQDNAEVTRRKEEEWVRRGGKVAATGADAEEVIALRTAALQEYTEKGRKNAEEREARMQVDFDEDDPSDEDWTQARGSASPQPREDSDADADDGGEEDITMVNEDEDEDGLPSHVKSRRPRRARAVIDSDVENEENVASGEKTASFVLRQAITSEGLLGQEDSDENHSISPIELAGTMHRDSISSMDERTEDEGDKENNTHLMYDRSEDKENKAVPRLPFGARPGLGRQGSLFGLEEGIRRGLSMSPGDRDAMSDGGDDENDAGGDKRRPLQRLLSEEDPFLVDSGASGSVDFAARLKQASPLPEQPIRAPAASLQPSFGAGLHVGPRAAGFSQFSDDESTGFSGVPLQPGFSQLFESGTEQQRPPKRPLGLSGSFSEKSESGLFALRKTTVSLGLTQDLDLQPAFQVGDNLKRQADSIFEKEQEYLWEAANRKSETKKEELYINDHGFVMFKMFRSSNRPDVADPEVYRPSSPSQSTSSFGTQRSTLLDPQSLLRRPLRTLSLTESVELEAPERSPLRRLAKRMTTPSPTHLQQPARDEGAEATKALDKSEFVVDEAQESDDDEMLGFGHKKDDGEEEDGEDMDRTLETLVDDQEMDEETVAAERVLEKFQEHAQEDDLKNELLQQAVVQGELRKKRRNRLGLDDSDEEEEEDMRARKIRRHLQEPRIDRDNVNELAKDPNTAPFYQVYKKDLERDDDGDAQDADMDSGDENGREVLTRKELTERLRAVARQEQAEPELDVNDVSWVDRGSDDEVETKIKSVSLRRAVVGQQLDGDIESRHGTTDERERKRLDIWAKREGRTRNVGTGRASGRTAVTGQSKPKTDGGSLRTTGVQAGLGKPSEMRRSLKVQPSVLAGVASERSARS